MCDGWIDVDGDNEPITEKIPNSKNIIIRMYILKNNCSMGEVFPPIVRGNQLDENVA